MHIHNDTKKCSNCGEIKPIASFYKRSNESYRSHCISCIAKKREAKKQNIDVQIPLEKRCGKCKTIKSHDEFHKNSTVKDGLASICKQCKTEYDAANSDNKSANRLNHNSNTKEYRREWYKSNMLLKRFYTAKRRALLKQSTPSWANQSEIRMFYLNCPQGYEVDHIIPIVSKVVCGLHCVENMQYLTREQNIKKGNKLICHMINS